MVLTINSIQKFSYKLSSKKEKKRAKRISKIILKDNSYLQNKMELPLACGTYSAWVERP